MSTYIKCKEVRHIEAQQIENLFAGNIRNLLMDAKLDYDKLYEIRLRVGRPLFLTYDGGECFLRKPGQEQYLVTTEDLKETLEYVTGYSLYAYEDEIRQGFISVQGCADKVMPYIRTEKWVANTLIISPPRCGKTTLLRDIIRQLSNGWANTQGLTIGVVDERSELAGCYQGIPQNDLGMRTDVLDCCPKSEGMQMLVRSMSPDVVAVDELGCEEDFKAVDSVIHCGCKLIATAHGSCLEDVLDQPFFYKLMGEKVFERYIILDKNDQAGCLKAVLDENGKVCLEQ